MATYINQSDLEDALSRATVLAIYDDEQTGAANPKAIGAVIDRAEAMVDSFLAPIYPLPMRVPSDRLLKHAALEFAISFSFERHPEYVRTFGEDQRAARWNRAVALMERITSAVQMLPDTSREKKPANSGGIVYDRSPRVLVDSADGTSNQGDF